MLVWELFWERKRTEKLHLFHISSPCNCKQSIEDIIRFDLMQLIVVLRKNLDSLDFPAHRLLPLLKYIWYSAPSVHVA